MKRTIIFHPFLFALYPIIALLAYNSDQIEPGEAVRATFILLIGTTLLFGLFRLWLKDWQKAGLLLSIYLIVIFGYGHIESYITHASSLPSLLVRQFLLILTALLFIIGSWWLWRFFKRDLTITTRFLNIMILVAMALPFLTLATNTVRSLDIHNQPVQSSESNMFPNIPPDSNHPDIYYIILDGYARADVMTEVFGYDNSEFIDWLTGKGFYVADDAHSNYAYTAFSLSSSLNYKYLDDVAEQVGIHSSDRNPLTPLIEQSQVRQFLESQGYTTIAFATGFNQTEIRSSDIYLKPEGNVLNEFEYMLIQKTIPGVLFAGDQFLEIKRQHVFNILDNLHTVPNMTEGPKFVFAHIYAPHEPPAFGANGEPLSKEDYDVADLVTHGYLSKTYLEAYTNEVTYLNKKLQVAINEILESSDEPPIIIIQSDHGSRVYMDSSSKVNSCPRERMSILNALYLPGDGASQVYESITPVNTFRVIFNTYFNTEFDLL
ncbi:MAG: sulfatase-like hydrolase/transferase, partial [Anaerolineae bacterium]|nr:sulfatase-like hydrolase/transferase [Anaerolineae bacterium]